MSLERIREKLMEGIYLNVIKTKKFKSNSISFYFIRNLNEKEVTKNALIPLVLKRGTSSYENAMDIEKKLEELYGSNLSINVNKKGEKQVLRFTIEGPHKDFINMKNIFTEQLKILREVIYNPILENGVFLDKYVKQEKNNLKKKIKGRINNKKQYAVERCIEKMCKEEKYSLYKYGYIEDLDNISSKKLYKHYKTVLKRSPIEINVVGNVDSTFVKNSIEEIFTFEREEIINIPREEISRENIKVKNVKEELDINQGKLTIGYRTNIPYEDKLYEAFLVGNNILGGGPDSKLFINVREKESLAYYVFSKLLKYKSLMLITSGIEFHKYEKSLDIIKKQVNQMKKGNFNNDNITQAKNAIITSVKSLIDDNYSISEFYLTQTLTKDKRNIDEIIKDIENVSKDDIINAFNKIELDTIYFLKNKEANKEE
ncbi:MAG: insulinase family protein [Firmicutes bacterium]|nr:insulinase family protein [Bacillota bacterium]